MYKHLHLVSFMASLLIISLPICAQVGINTDGSQPDSSAMLDVKSNNKGFLPPRVALSSINSPNPITSPANGLLIYNTATAGIPPNNVTSGYYYWNGMRWISLAKIQSDWNEGSVPFAGASGVLSQDNSHFFWDSIHHWLGIGKNNPSTALDVVGSATVTMGNYSWGYRVQAPSGAWNIRTHGYEDASIVSNNVTDDPGYASFDAMPTADNSSIQPIDHIIGFQSRPIYNSNFNMGTQFGGMDIKLTHNGSGIIPTTRGLHINDVQGTGTNTLNMGLEIEDIVNGTTNYSIFTRAGKVYFGDTVDILHGINFTSGTPSYINWTLGGGNSKVDYILGIPNNHQLQFATNGNPVLKMYSDQSVNFLGNVGIGIANAGYKLQVVGGKILLNTDGDNLILSNHKATGSQGYNIWIGGGGQSVTYSSGNDGSFNVSLGISALQNVTSGFANMGIGAYALQQTTTGYQNMAMGWYSLVSNTTGHDNMGIGNNCLLSNSTGSSNTGIGSSVMYNNTTGYQNTAIGTSALFNNVTGYQNVAIGTGALINNTTANNTGIGNTSLYDLNDGWSNTAIGWNTGRGIVHGYGNTIIGAGVSGLDANLSNTVIIADGDGHQRIYVDNRGNVGIGRTSPSEKLEVNGNIKSDDTIKSSNEKLTGLSGSGSILGLDGNNNVIKTSGGTTYTGTLPISVLGSVISSHKASASDSGYVDPTHFNNWNNIYANGWVHSDTTSTLETQKRANSIFQVKGSYDTTWTDNGYANKKQTSKRDTVSMNTLEVTNITLTASDTSVAIKGKSVFISADSSYYDCRSTISAHKWWKRKYE
jgi:hypothetical protein